MLHLETVAHVRYGLANIEERPQYPVQNQSFLVFLCDLSGDLINGTQMIPCLFMKNE